MNEAVTVKKREREGVARILSTGVRATLKPVQQSVIQDAVAMLHEPPVPMWTHPEKGREEPNPADPDYQKALAEHRQQVARVTFDVFALYGIELEKMPEDDRWLKELKLSAKLGHVDLDRFDLEDEIDLEFLYKRYVAMGNQDYMEIGRLSGISPEEVSRAADSFQGDEAR